jgi:hypothetical protein
MLSQVRRRFSCTTAAVVTAVQGQLGRLKLKLFSVGCHGLNSRRRKTLAPFVAVATERTTLLMRPVQIRGELARGLRFRKRRRFESTWKFRGEPFRRRHRSNLHSECREVAWSEPHQVQCRAVSCAFGSHIEYS